MAIHVNGAPAAFTPRLRAIAAATDPALRLRHIGPLDRLVALLLAGDGLIPLKALALLAAYLTIMTAVCMLAWIVPTRRALGVEPIEALRVDG